MSELKKDVRKGITGGIPSKLGNRYEAKWLVRCLFDVIYGKEASWLKFEGIHPEYEGFEFAIQYGEIVRWHQTKINAPKGNWTINQLNEKGLLVAFKNRLSEDENYHCYFVSQDSAKDLETLSEKSRIANNCDEYYNCALSKDDTNEFEKLIDKWSCTKEEGFKWLTRTHVVIIAEKQIESLIESYSDSYFQSGGKSVFPELRDILEDNFNKEITTEVIRKAIKSQGKLKIKEWSLDPTIRQKLAEETCAYLDTYSPFGAGGSIISRKQSDEVLDELHNADGAELILLTGVAGSGKSGVVRSVIKQLSEKNILHLAFRVDHHLNCSTREELGKKLTGREESPVSTLKGVSPDKQTVLIIDQVDAVSEVSGRDGQVKEVIFRMIADTHNFGDVRVIIVCRTFDLESDARFKGLKSKNKTRQIDIPLLDWKTEVESLLTEKGITVNVLSERQRELLQLPVNLAIFLEIGDNKLTFESRSALLRKLVEKKQRVIENRKPFPSWALLKPLTTMCNWMSQHQQLHAPENVLDDYAGAIDVLRSEGLIVSSSRKINFFHESFFDYIYARAFVKNNRSLLELLLSTEQHLFRRTQVRQILDSLRQDDFERYLNELSSVLSKTETRFHIKTAISQWLNSIEKPTLREFDVIIAFDDFDSNFDQLVRNALLVTDAWFDFLNKKQWIRQQLEHKNEQRRNTVLRWLSNIVGQHSDEIAVLLRTWWGNNPERAEKLLNWFKFVERQKLDEVLLKIYEDVIKSYPANLFKDGGREQFSLLLDTWKELNSELAGPLLRILFDAWFALNPGRNPFERDELGKINTYYLAELAEIAPLAFLDGTTDALIRAVDMVIAEGKTTENYYNFSHRVYSGDIVGFDFFLRMYRSALQHIAETDPEKALEYLEKLDATKHECFMHLHLETIQVNPEFLGSCLIKLFPNSTLFNAGWEGARWKSFTDTAHAVIPTLSLENREKLENLILSYHPEIKFAINKTHKIKKEGEGEFLQTRKGCIYNLQHSGQIQWYILETIGEEKLTKKALVKLYQLRRKFPHESVGQPHHIEAYTVNSPIKQSQCKRMTDQNWLSAILRYDTEENYRHSLNKEDGGARELADQLQQFTQKEPERFSKFCQLIPYTAHHAYIESILRGLTEVKEPNYTYLAQVIHYAHVHPDKPFGKWIARLVGKHPTLARDPEILKILIWYAEYGEANSDEKIDEYHIKRETVIIETLLQHSQGSCLQIRGTNGVRGQAWESLSFVLWEIPEAAPKIWSVLENALNHEELISVHCCMIYPLIPLFNDDKVRFSNAIQKLIVLPENSPQANESIRLSPLMTHLGIRLFPYIFYWLPEVAKELAFALLESDDNNMVLAGAWLVFRESFRNDNYVECADTLAKLSVEHRRLLADVSADAIKWADNRYRVKELIKLFFFDEDEQVRERSANVFRNISADEIFNYHDIATEFLKSPTFLERTSPFLRMLEEATCDVLHFIVQSSEKLIRNIINGIIESKQHDSDLHQLQDLLKREYASSERNLPEQKKILDLIDLMFQYEFYGVNKIVETHER